MNAEKNMKRVLLIATGGTIASTSDGSGLAPTMGARELANAVPELADLCELAFVQPMNIDSTNMRPSDWLAIADVIADSYADFDAFVVLHGTDTMAYTAAALSYLIQGGSKPIVLTGAQQPIARAFTDARLNLYQSVLYACDPSSRNVSVVFGGKAICGTRARKQRTMSYNAFTSMNFPTLADIHYDRIFHRAAARVLPADSIPMTHYTALDERVIVLKLTPALDPTIFELLKPSYDAVILETFGIGGIPSHSDAYQNAILDWVDSGRTIVMTTQVPEEGLDLGVYEVGRAYANNPAILKGDDMTTEALVAKTMWALGQSRDPQKIAELFYQPINHDRTPQPR